jgi:SAM-dependent methyltransferase
MNIGGGTINDNGCNPVDVYAQALISRRLRAVDDAGQDMGMGVTRWLEPASRDDEILLAHCTRNTLDVGCGPGRLSAALTEAGVSALGIDVSAEAVQIARQRGATALRRDVFASVPGQGRWPNLPGRREHRDRRESGLLVTPGRDNARAGGTGRGGGRPAG